MTDPVAGNPLAADPIRAWRTLVGSSPGSPDADVLERLASTTPEGLRIDPLYARAEPRPVRSTARPWQVMQRIDHPEPDDACRQARTDVEGGATGLVLVLEGALSARGFGLRAGDVPDVLRILARDLPLHRLALRLEGGDDAPEAMRALAGLDLGAEIDPIGRGAVTGEDPSETIRTAAALPVPSGFLADGRPYHEAGAGEAQELAAVLATGLAYLRALEAAGIGPDRARTRLAFLLVTDADPVLSLCKLRALRRLWSAVETACGLAPSPIRLHAETAWRMTSRLDPSGNILRTTLAAAAAAWGGADTLAVLPFTAALGLPDEKARRLALTTQLVLRDEAHLGRVADPAAGSGAVETLTNELCSAAWVGLQALEREGGIVPALRSGRLGDEVAAVAERRRQAVAAGERALVGTTVFRSPDEQPVAVLAPLPDPPAFAAGWLPRARRDAEPFEAGAPP